MSRYTITLTDGTSESGLAAGTPDEVYTYLSAGQRGLKSLKVTQADDITWPDASESPCHY